MTYLSKFASLIVRLRFVLVGSFIFGTSATFAAEMLNVPQHIWDSLLADQRTTLSERYAVNVVEGNSYGTILDAQSLNESTAGTNIGSQLGSRYASAGYVDNAFKGSPQSWNYSATGHLTAQLAGALLGSLADKPAEARFRTRYTIKTGSGGVEYVEENKGDALRHSIGLCVTVRPIRPIEFDTCTQTPDQFLAKYAFLLTPSRNVLHPGQPTRAPGNITPTATTPESLVKAQAVESGDFVQCKIGLASPIRVTASVCESAGGAIYR